MPRPSRVSPSKTKQRAKPSTKTNTGGVLDFAEVIEETEDDFISLGIFGASATGKTTLWSGFPGPTLALFCSGNLKNPGELKSLSKEEKSHITALKITSTDQLVSVISSLAKDMQGFVTVVIDHLTSISDMIVADMLGVDKAKPQKEWGDMSQQEWGKFSSNLKIILRDFLDLEANSIIVCQEKIFEPPEDSEIGITKVGPAVTPGVAQWLTSTLNYSIQTFVRAKTVEKKINVRGKEKTKIVKLDELQFCAYLPLSEHRMTKFRKPRGIKLDPVMVDPTYEKLKAVINQ